MKKGIFFAVAVLLLAAGCGGGSSSGSTGGATGGSTDPAQVFSLAKANTLEPGTLYSFSVTGSDSEGNTVTGTLQAANREAVMFEGQLVTPRDFLVSGTAGGQSVAVSGTTYFDQAGNYIGTAAQTAGRVCTPASLARLPDSVKVGDFGILPMLSCTDNTTVSWNWRADPAGSNRLHLVVAETNVDSMGRVKAVSENRITLNPAGDFLGIRLEYAEEGYSFTVQSN